VVVVLGVTAAWFCRLQITAYAGMMQSGVFHPWSDFFVHGAQVAQFGDPLAVDRGDILEAGRPLAFYHYGMFMLPAALLALPGAPPALAIASSALLVFGLLVAILGCYALAFELACGMAALIAVAAVMLLPDAAALWPGNGSFGFHWLMMIAPGSAYAIGVAAVALVYLMRWQQQRRWADALCCGLLVASVALLRAQIFVVLVPACVLAAVYSRFYHRARQITACLVACMLLLALASIFIEPFQHWFEARTHFTEFIGFAYLLPLPDSLAQPYATLAHVTGSVCASWIGWLLLPVLILGPWVLVAPLVAIYLHRRRLLSRHDLIPLMVLLAYLGVVVFAPTPSNGDFTEYKQRPFVLIYVVFLLWPIARLLGAVTFIGQPRSSRAFAAVAIASFCVIGALALLLQKQDPQANPAVWTAKYFDIRQPAGLGDAAAFIRAHARLGDVMASVGGCQDPSVPLASMTGMPQYFARGGVQWSRRDHDTEDLDPHVTVMRALESSDSSDAAARLLTQAKIAWLVVIEPEPGCDRRGPPIDTPAFQSHQTAVIAAAH
jgi:hypothetical protein